MNQAEGQTSAAFPRPEEIMDGAGKLFRNKEDKMLVLHHDHVKVDCQLYVVGGDPDDRDDKLLETAGYGALREMQEVHHSNIIPLKGSVTHADHTARRLLEANLAKVTFACLLAEYRDSNNQRQTKVVFEYRIHDGKLYAWATGAIIA